MSTSNLTPVQIAKKSFELNGWSFYEMNDKFNQIGRKYRYMIVKYNSRSGKTHLICIFNLRSLINLAYKKGYSSYNPYQISNLYSFQKGFLYRDSFNGDRSKNAPQLKYIKDA